MSKHSISSVISYLDTEGHFLALDIDAISKYTDIEGPTFDIEGLTFDIEGRRGFRWLHTTLNIRHRMFVNIVGATYDIVGQTYDIVGSIKCMSYTMSYLPENLRHRRFVNSCRIRCRRCISYTMS